MPRMRTIKPEFCTSEQVVNCSPTARLLFACMWMHCDDAGRHPDSLKRLKMEVFPADPFSDEQIGEWVQELIEQRLLVHYVVCGKGFWQVTGWHHQKIDKPYIRHPAPPGCMKFDDHSTNGRGAVVDHSPPEAEAEAEAELEADIKEAERDSTTARPLAVFSKLKSDDLKDTAKLMATLGPNASDDERLRILGVAVRALASGKKPIALFMKIIKEQDWNCATIQQEAAAASRLKAWQARAGPPTPNAAVVAESLIAPTE